MSKTTRRHTLILNRIFVQFAVARGIDILGSSMTTVAMPLAVWSQTHNPSAMGVISASAMVPMLMFLVFGGAVADRFNRRTLLVLFNFLSFLAMAAMGVLLLRHQFSYVTFVPLSFLTGFLTGMSSPALRGIVPELVPASDLAHANAVLESMRNALRIAGPLLAGILVSAFNGGWALISDGVSFAAAAALLFRIPLPSSDPAPSEGMLRDLHGGWRAFRSLSWLMPLSLLAALMNAFNIGPWTVLGPALVSSHSFSAAWGVVLSVRAVGLFVASLLCVRFARALSISKGLALGGLSCLPLLALGINPTAAFVAVAAFIGAFGFTTSGLTWTTTMQLHAPAAERSRIMAFDDFFSFSAIPLSQLAVGPLSAQLGARHLELICGVLYLVVVLCAAGRRDVRALSNEPAD